MVKGVFNQNNQQQFTVEMKREDVKSFSDIMVFNSIDKNYDGVLQEAEVREYDAQQAKLNKGFEIAPEKQKTLSQIIKADKEAKKAFLDQLEDDGWAADVADGISILWNSKNRASKVREDFDESKSVINKLVEAAKVSDAEFLKAFKNAYGVDYNQELIDEYFKNPTKETFEKAFGTVQKDMTTRVEKYNESQEKGAKAVKTGAKMAAGVAVAVATGGTSLVATAAGAGGAALATAVTTTATTSLAATAVGTAAASIVIDETDRLKVTELLTEGDVEFREGTNHKQILTEGAVTGISVYAAGKLAQGVKMIVPANVSINSVGEVIEVALTKGQKVARTALTMVGNVVIGAGEEYITTGDVTLSGTVQNAALSGLGSAVEYGFFKDGVKLIKGKLGFAAKNADEVLENLSSSNVVKVQQTFDEDGLPIAGGLFNKNDTGSFWGRAKSKLGLSSKIDSQTKQVLKSNYMSDIVDRVEINDNYVLSGRLQDALGRKSYVNELDASINPRNISQYIGDGEVASIGGKLFVNDAGTPVQLGLSKRKFDELFPPIETSTFSQPGGTMVCTIQAKINGMLDSNGGKVALYSMFEEQGDDIIVNLRGNRKPVVFEGGKPMNINLRDHNANLFCGDAPGIEMLQQSVLIDRIRNASETTDLTNVSDFSAQSLIKKANQQANDATASVPLLGKSGKTTVGSTNITSLLENDYKPGEDILTATWDGHQKSIVNYDKNTRRIVYHDPMHNGTNVEESLEEFLNHGGTSGSLSGPWLYLNKRSSITDSTPNFALESDISFSGNVATPDVNFVRQKVPVNSDTGVEVVSAKKKRYTIGDEKPTTPTPKANDSGIEIVGSRPQLAIPEGYKPAGKIKVQGVEYNAIQHIEKNSFKVEVDGKWVKPSDLSKSKASAQTINSQTVNVEKKPAFGLVDDNTTPKPQVKPQLAIPAGYREYGKIMGKRAIIDSDNVVLIQKGEEWVRLN